MQLIKDTITVDELKKMSEKMFGRIVKAVVDIEKEVMVVDAEMHADEEEFLLEQGSEQNHLWGINFHPYETDDDFVEFDSMINMRPSFGNRSRSVEDPAVQKRIIELVNRLVKR